MKRWLISGVAILALVGVVYAQTPNGGFPNVPTSPGTSVTLPLSPSNGGTGGTSGAPAAQSLSHTWLPCSAVAAGQSISSPQTLTTLAVCTIPAGVMTSTSALRLTYQFNYTNNANTKTLQIHFGTASTCTGATYLNTSVTTTVILVGETFIVNQGALNSQIGTPNNGTVGNWGSTLAPPITSTVDTTNQSFVTFCAQDTNVAGDTVTLNYAFVEMLPSSGN